MTPALQDMHTHQMDARLYQLTRGHVPTNVINMLIRATIHMLNTPTNAGDDYATKRALDAAIARVATGR